MRENVFFVCVSGYLIWMDPFNETSQTGLCFLCEFMGYTPVLKVTFSNVKSIVQNDLTFSKSYPTDLILYMQKNIGETFINLLIFKKPVFSVPVPAFCSQPAM